jgi:hypothetical protein
MPWPVLYSSSPDPIPLVHTNHIPDQNAFLLHLPPPLVGRTRQPDTQSREYVNGAPLRVPPPDPKSPYPSVKRAIVAARMGRAECLSPARRVQQCERGL